MSNIIKVSVENVEDLLSAFGASAKVRLEKSSTGGGTGFSEVTTATLVSGTYVYTLMDTTGVAGDYYRHRFSTSTPSVASDYSPYSDEYRGGIDTGLCSIYDAKQRLNIPATDTSEDENLLDYIRQATAFIESTTGRWFLPRSGSYTLDGNDDTVMWFPKGVQSVSALEIDGTALALTDFVLRPTALDRELGWPADRIVLTEGHVFTDDFDNVEITGVFGWEAIPEDITEVALNIVNALHRARGSSGGDQVTINLDGSRVIERSLSYQDKATLTFYRVIRV